MSFYLRTVVKIGPARLSVTQAGVDVSTTVLGLPAGLPRASSVRIDPQEARYLASPARGAGPAPRPGDPPAAAEAKATTLLPAGPGDLVSQLNAAAGTQRIFPWVLLAVLLLAVVSPYLLLPGAALATWAWWYDQVRRTVLARYEVCGPRKDRYQHLVDAFAETRRAKKAWRVVAEADVRTTREYKVNSGASSLVRRQPLSRDLDGPPQLRSNIAIPSLRSPGRSLYFLPDRVLVQDKSRYAEVSYQALQVHAEAGSFVEDGTVPSDAEKIGRTWRYVNVSGGPDRRYKDNRELPVLRYANLILRTTGGLDLRFTFSRVSAGTAFADALAAMGRMSLARPVAATAPAASPVASAPVAAAAPVATVGLPGLRERDPSNPAAGSAVPGTATEQVHPARLLPLSEDGRLAVVGESHYQEALREIAGGMAFGSDFDEHLPVRVLLVPEPENPYDRNAVRVDVLHESTQLTVGYLARENAERYQPHLLRLRDSGCLGTCAGRITRGGEKFYGIYLHLAPPEYMMIANAVSFTSPADPPGAAGSDAATAPERPRLVVLSAETPCAVTKEERHEDILMRYAPACDGEATRVVVTLAYCTVQGGKYRGERALEVRLDGSRVGELTYAMTRRYAPVVDAVHRDGAVAACEALVLRSPRGPQVELRLPRVTG